MATTKAGNLSGNNLMVVLLLITLLVIGVSGLAVRALFSSIALDTKVVAAKSKADKQLKENLTAAPKLVEAYDALGPEAVTLANALPNSVDLPSLIVQIENMGNAAGVKIKTIAPLVLGTDVATETSGESNTTPVPQMYQFSVTFDGTYESLKKLLASVETSARPMRIVGMQLNGSGSALSGEVGIQTFYQEKAQLPFGKESIK